MNNRKKNSNKSEKIDYIYSHIRHISIRTISVLFIPTILIFAIAYYIPFKEIFNPPTLTYANSAYTKYDAGKEYIEIQLTNALYTGYDCTRSGKIVGSYYYCLTNNSCTFILVDTTNMNKIPQVLENYTIKAKLIQTDKLMDDVLKDFSLDIGWTYDGLKSISSPVMIDETEYNYGFYIYLAISFGLLLMILISLIIMNFLYIIIPGLHPACISFIRLTGEQKKLSQVNCELNTQVILYSGNITLTPNYLVTSGHFKLEIIPINSIIWAYKHSTLHRLLGIKFKLTYTLNILCKKRIYFSSPRNNKEDIDIILDYLKSHYPDILLEYSKENKLSALKIINKK